jgi:uncharacterized membrane protein
MVEFFNGIPKEAATFIAAMLPITELRGSIPLAITVWDVKPATAYIVSVLGNLVPLVVILYIFDPVQKYLSENSPMAKKFFKWLYARTRNKLDMRVKRFGPLALCLFVAVPLPVTGVWTGAVAAWLFGIKKVPAIIFITLGALIAGFIVTVITVGSTFVF